MKPSITQALQTALNRYLALDPETKTHFKRLQGKKVTLELTGIKMKVHLVFTEQGIEVTTDASIKADAVITGSPLSLLHMTLNKKDRQRFFAEDVSIQGDLDLGQEVIDLFDNMEIDWEEYLSRYIGDVSAHQIGRAARSVKNFVKRTHEMFLQNTNEYVHEEIDLFPAREALQDFFQEVDALRMDVDRLEARVAQLLKKVETRS